MLFPRVQVYQELLQLAYATTHCRDKFSPQSWSLLASLSGLSTLVNSQVLLRVAEQIANSYFE